MITILYYDYCTVGVFILHMTNLYTIIKLIGYNEIPCFKYLNQAFCCAFFFFFYKFYPIKFHFVGYLYSNQKNENAILLDWLNFDGVKYPNATKIICGSALWQKAPLEVWRKMDQGIQRRSCSMVLMDEQQRMEDGWRVIIIAHAIEPKILGYTEDVLVKKNPITKFWKKNKKKQFRSYS